MVGEQGDMAIQWMGRASAIAERALCLRDKCGSILVQAGEVIGEGYNAPPLDMKENQLCSAEIGPGKPKFDRTCCMHAEWRALMDALRRNPTKLPGSTLYFTRVGAQGQILRSGQPYCTVCSRMALDAGVKMFVLWHDDGICAYPTDEYNQLSYNFVAAPKVLQGL